MAVNEFFEDLDKDFVGDSEHAFNVQEKVNDIKRELKSESKMDIEKESYGLYIPFTNDDEFILKLFNYFIKLFHIHYEPAYIVNTLRQYFKDNNANPLDIFNQLIHHQNQSYFTSIIGYLYQFGIGTEISYRLANKFYTRSIIQELKTSNSDLPFINELIENNQNIGKISLACLYLF
ncbi:6337_t:CDS:2, partial [Gigaspora rosea]